MKNNSVFHDTPESYEIVEFDDAIGRWEKRFYAISTIWVFKMAVTISILSLFCRTRCQGVDSN